MKRGTKIALLTAAALLILGAVLCGIALRSVDFRLSRLSTTDSSARKTETAAFDAKEMNVIKIQIAADDVHLVPSPDQQIHLKFTQRDQTRYMLSAEDGTLSLTQQAQSGHWDLSWFAFDFNFDDFDVVLEIPDGYPGDLQLVGDVGDVECTSALRLGGTLDCQLQTGSFEADGLQARSVAVQTDVGEITGERWSIGPSISLSTASGDISLEHSTVEGNLICQSDLGSISLEDTAADAADLSAQTGDIELEALSPRTLKAATDIGSISGTIAGAETEFAILVDTDIGDSNLKSRVGPTDRQLSLSTQTGDISIRFTNPS